MIQHLVYTLERYRIGVKVKMTKVTKGGSKSKIPPAKLNKAKKLYLEYSSVSEIARETGVVRTALQYHVNKEGGWKYERDINRADLLSKVASARASEFADMTNYTIISLKRAVKSLAERTDPPTVQEAKGVAAILESLDKMTRLDEGKPTDIITEEKVVTVKELQKKISVDPFAKEVEFEEID